MRGCRDDLVAPLAFDNRVLKAPLKLAPAFSHMLYKYTCGGHFGGESSAADLLLSSVQPYA